MCEPDLTDLLLAHRRGDPQAFDQVVHRLYPELKRLARGQLARWRSGETLDTTALVHETYLKVADQNRLDLVDRAHFLAVAARAMRLILIDYARARSREKRGRGERPWRLDEGTVTVEEDAEGLLALNEALERLSAAEPRLFRVVECRYFAGYSEAETAAALGVSTRTVERDWLKAKAWLRELLG